MFHEKQIVCTVPLQGKADGTDMFGNPINNEHHGNIVVKRSLVSGALFITSDYDVREKQYMGYSVHYAITAYAEFLAEHFGLDVDLADGWDRDFDDAMYIDPWEEHDPDDELQAAYVAASRTEGYE